MADTNTANGQGTKPTPQGEGTDQTAAAAQSGEAFEPITSQEEFDRRIKARIARVKATPPADYEDLKAKAARYDELEAANKSDLERANDAAAKAKADAAKWKAEAESLRAERERADAVSAAAAEYGVDADMLSRMAGDVEANAKFLRDREDARPKFGTMHDGGEQTPPAETLEDRLRGARNESERIRIRAEFNARNRGR